MLTLTNGKRLLILLFAFVIGFCITSVISTFIAWKFGATAASLRIVAVMQDVFMFIMPALLTAMMVTRMPATLLAIDVKPTMSPILVATCTLIAAIPLINAVVALNQAIPLPEGVAAFLQQMQEQTEGSQQILMGGHTVGALIMSILIMGVFAGLSEELLFRGAFQRLLSKGGMNIHASIWIVALVFSMMHLQFDGLIGRMLLGAFFGYLLYWTGSLWVPVILHIINNTLYLCAEWAAEGKETHLDTVGTTTGDVVVVLISVALTACGLYLLWRNRAQKCNLVTQNNG